MSSQKLLIFIYLPYRLKFGEEYDNMDTTRSDKIKAGLQRSFRSGKSAKASIVCYGYRVGSKCKLQIYPAEAAHVRYIFERFATGDSLGKISDALFLKDIPSPSGKEVTLGKTQVQNGVQVKTTDFSTRTTLTNHHPAIISKELFDSVQKKSRRHELHPIC